MKLNNFGRSEHRMVSQAMLVALKAVGDDFGIDFKADGGTIGSLTGQVKISIFLRADEKNPSGAEAQFRQSAPMIGAKPEWFGEPFIHKRETFIVQSINLNAPVYPIIAARSRDNASFRFPVRTITGYLGGSL